MLHYEFLKTSVLYWLIIFECVQLEFREELNAPGGEHKGRHNRVAMRAALDWGHAATSALLL